MNELNGLWNRIGTRLGGGQVPGPGQHHGQAPDADNIPDDQASMLEQVLADAAKMGGVKISATGHADRSGSEDYNMALSLRRADSVREALIAGMLMSVTSPISSSE